ncbi:hypothetical protein, partial [Bradyrhizobium sp.]|uniref:hypothetical protein n=1 Tax=Bradyrhizobium sp. TaxID=376 RepID=UPI001EB0F96E
MKRSKAIGQPESQTISRYPDLVSARLEQRAAKQLEAAKFETRVSLDRFRNKKILEIDVIGARVRKRVTEILVIEAKDIDMPLHKPGSLDDALRTLQRGADQLKQRTAWVLENW